MAYWWLLERKSFKDEPIKLTPNVGEKVQAAWLQGQAKIFLPQLKIAIDGSDIKAIGPSTEVMVEDNFYKLASSLDEDDLRGNGQVAPIFLPDYEEKGVQYRSSVLCNWYKMNIDRREWDTRYSASPGYYRLDTDDGAVWIAMLLPEEKNRTRSNNLIACSQPEIKYLNEKRNQ